MGDEWYTRGRMSIKILNQKTLATTSLRRDALRIMKAGIQAVETGAVVKKRVSRTGEKLLIDKKSYRLDRYERIFVVGVGKASYDAGKALESILGDRITDGIVLDVKGGKLRYLKSLVGTHPFPSHTNIRATAEMLGILKGVTAKDLVITVISGGGSALLCWPHQLECDDVTKITQVLMKRGATIHELNTVRKHISEIQGGQLAGLAYPATVVSLIFSDVPGDDISMVASGPTVLDVTTVKDAQRVMKKYQVLDLCRLEKCDLRETPKDPLLFSHVQNVLMVSNEVAVEAMKKKAKELGYAPVVYSTQLDGEAREAGKLFASLVKPGQALIGAGETTVTIRGTGDGGRNQEFALGALETLPPQSLLLSLASDGIDNGPMAGALIDDQVKKVVQEKHLDPDLYLQQNNSLPFFQETESFIKTGMTGVNVSDLMLCLQKQKS